MTMSRLAMLHNEANKEQIKSFQSVVVHSLKDADISVRRRALDLLFVMTDATNAESIVDELVTYLVAADSGIREQMVLKIAVLSEKFATSKKWYVDTVLKLISISGDQVSDSIWHRVIVIVTNNPDGDLQQYVAETMFEVCKSKVRGREGRLGPQWVAGGVATEMSILGGDALPSPPSCPSAFLTPRPFAPHTSTPFLPPYPPPGRTATPRPSPSAPTSWASSASSSRTGRGCRGRFRCRF